MYEWKHNSARAIGTSHISSNIPCQDNVVTLTSNGVTVAVLSDGCGTAHFSEHGSKMIVDNLSKYVCDNFDELYSKSLRTIKHTLMIRIINDYLTFYKKHEQMFLKYINTPAGKAFIDDTSSWSIMNKLDEKHRRYCIECSMLNATMLLVAIKGNKCLIAHCGDGVILGHKDKKLSILSLENKTGAKNETVYPSALYFLLKAYNDPKDEEDFRVIKFDKNEYDGFVLMSDGAEDSLVPDYPVKSIAINNTNILFDMTIHEESHDAHIYLQELLEQTYRTRYINNEPYEVTDDDVSVAVLALPSIDLDDNVADHAYVASKTIKQDVEKEAPRKTVILSEASAPSEKHEELVKAQPIFEKPVVKKPVQYEELPKPIDTLLKMQLPKTGTGGFYVAKYNLLRPRLLFVINALLRGCKNENEIYKQVEEEFNLKEPQLVELSTYVIKCKVRTFVMDYKKNKEKK